MSYLFLQFIFSVCDWKDFSLQRQKICSSESLNTEHITDKLCKVISAPAVNFWNTQTTFMQYIIVVRTLNKATI